MRGKLALQMCVAHFAGLLLVSIIGVFQRSDPSLADAFVYFIISDYSSLLLFLPALVITLILARSVYENLILFVLFGPLLVGALIVSTFGIKMGGVISLGVAFSSSVFFFLARQSKPAGRDRFE
ncbi:MAG: hypothetical protein AAF692_01910 [Pseudomonadota bacterium]